MKRLHDKFDLSEDIKEFGIDFVENAFAGYKPGALYKLYNDYTNVRQSNFYDSVPNPSFVNTDNVCATMLDRYGKSRPYYPFCYAGYFFDNYLEVINKDYKDARIEIAEWSKD